MKPVYVALIAIASALVGGLIGAALGGTVGSVVGGTGGGVLGMQAGVCSAADTAKAQKLLSPAQADQLLNQSIARLGDVVTNKELAPSKPDCQKVLNEVKALSK